MSYTFSGIPVRCMDCINRKECKKVSINKWKKKICKEYAEDLSKLQRQIERQSNTK